MSSKITDEPGTGTVPTAQRSFTRDSVQCRERPRFLPRSPPRPAGRTRMKRLVPAAVLLSALAAPGRAAAGPPPGTHEVRLNGQVFTLPEGFEVELAAGP